MKRIMIIKDSRIEEVIKEEDFNYYDAIIEDYLDEEAISFLEKNYSEYNTKYFDIVNVPEKATDEMVIDLELGSMVIVVIDGKMKVIYDNMYY